MNTQLKKILIGVVALVVLLAIYFVSMKVKSDKENADKIQNEALNESKSSEVDLIGKVSNDIKNAVIKRSTGEIELINIASPDSDDAVWSIKGYEDLKYNSSNIGIIAKSLSTLNAIEKIIDIDENTTADTLAEYGLDNPQTICEVNFKDGSTNVIFIGNETSDKTYNYTMVKGGDGVYIIDSINNDRFNYTLNDIIDKDIPSISEQKILYIDVKQKDKEEIEIEYKDEKNGSAEELAQYGMQTLTMVKPVEGVSVYPNNLQTTILKNLNNLVLNELIEVKPQDLSKYGLDNPYLDIKLKDTENEIGFKIGNVSDENNYYCMIDGNNAVFTMDKNAVSPFENIDIVNFIERFVSLVYKKNVEKIDMSGYGTKHEITFKDDETAEKTSEDEDTRIGLIDGKEIKNFANFYEVLIGVTFDSLSNTEAISGAPAVSIRFIMKDKSVKIVNYYNSTNSNYFIAEIDGDTSRLVNKQSVKNVFDMANKVISE